MTLRKVPEVWMHRTYEIRDSTKKLVSAAAAQAMMFQGKWVDMVLEKAAKKELKQPAPERPTYEYKRRKRNAKRQEAREAEEE